MYIKEIIQRLKETNTGGYFYADNCRLNYSSIYGWYCKDLKNNKMHTYNVSKKIALEKISQSLDGLTV